ncbi:hypothetical protein [Paraburkholderia youngii]|uniref:hypothetical protein n=1 Tax=Paraburkholderia youngii TaxID=2782701 RepID=UPI003D1D7719
MNNIIKSILAPNGHLPTLYHGTSRKQWTTDSVEAQYLRLTTKLTRAQRCASEAAATEADQGSLTAEGIVVAFTPASLKRLLHLGYVLEADLAYLRDENLGACFPVEPITRRAWQYSMIAYGGVVISGFLSQHRAGLKVMNVNEAEEVASQEAVPYPIISHATCLADLHVEHDQAVVQLSLEAIHFRTSGGSSLNLTRAINRINGLRWAISSIEAEQRALAARIARKILDVNDDEHALDAEVKSWCDSSAAAINSGGLESQAGYLLGLGRSEHDIRNATSLQQAEVV